MHARRGTLNEPNSNYNGQKIITNADTVLLKAGSAVLFEQCWHSGLSNAKNTHDRCVFYVQYARRILQPLDPAQYSSLREQPCSPLRQQLLMLPSDFQYLPDNRNCLYHPDEFEPLPLKIRHEERGIPFKLHQGLHPPAGYVKKVIPMAQAAQVDLLVQSQ